MSVEVFVVTLKCQCGCDLGPFYASEFEATTFTCPQCGAQYTFQPTPNEPCP